MEPNIIMDSLPIELVIHILRFTNTKSCQAISQASSEYRWILNEEKLWTSFGDNYHGYVLALSKLIGFCPSEIRYVWSIKKINGYFGDMDHDVMLWLYNNGQFTGDLMIKVQIPHYRQCMCAVLYKHEPLEEIWLKEGIYKIHNMILKVSFDGTSSTIKSYTIDYKIDHKIAESVMINYCCGLDGQQLCITGKSYPYVYVSVEDLYSHDINHVYKVDKSPDPSTNMTSIKFRFQ